MSIPRLSSRTHVTSAMKRVDDEKRAFGKRLNETLKRGNKRLIEIVRTMPTQKPGKSKQDYETPRDFMHAIRGRFGAVDWDLAASLKNSKADRAANHFNEKQNSLERSWCDLGELRFLNPPFGHITPWAKKCAEYEHEPRERTLFLVPASVGSDWYSNWVHPYAYVLALSPRISFDGVAGFPKDLILAVYSKRCQGQGTKGFDLWRWKE